MLYSFVMMTKLKRLALPAVLLSVSISACSVFSSFIPTPTPTGGIEGVVTEGPMCPGPVQVNNNPCPNQPYQATINILDTTNTQVSQVQADTSGHFKVALPPGTYILQPLSINPLPRAKDQTVVVDPGQYTRVTIIYDTGIR
jgi:hypothetical protein